jgi:hypothetical protein
MKTSPSPYFQVCNTKIMPSDFFLPFFFQVSNYESRGSSDILRRPKRIMVVKVSLEKARTIEKEAAPLHFFLRKYNQTPSIILSSLNKSSLTTPCCLSATSKQHLKSGYYGGKAYLNSQNQSISSHSKPRCFPPNQASLFTSALTSRGFLQKWTS